MDEAGATVEIGERYNGPPGSGNGGYACGVAARFLQVRAVTVRLLAPPPVGRPLTVHRGDHRVELADGDRAIAVATPWDQVPPAPEPLTGAQVAAAVAAFDVDAYLAGHPFPTCFTCGPGRPDRDGLGLFPAAVAGTDRVAWPWRPAQETADPTGKVRPEVLWAALDCPGGMSWMHGTGGGGETGPLVLGQLSVAIARRPTAGEELVVAGWPDGSEGRRRHARTAAWTAAGGLVAQGSATWIRLDADLAAAFAARGPAS